MVRSAIFLLLAATAVWAGEDCAACSRETIRVEGAATGTAHYLCRACSAVHHVHASGRSTYSRRVGGRRLSSLDFPLPGAEAADVILVAGPKGSRDIINRPGHPVTRPTHPVNRPSHPVNRPSHAVNRPNHAVTRPNHAVTRPRHPVERPAASVTRPGHAVSRPSHAVTRPAHSVNRPGHAIRRSGHPIKRHRRTSSGRNSTIWVRTTAPRAAPRRYRG